MGARTAAAPFGDGGRGVEETAGRHSLNLSLPLRQILRRCIIRTQPRPGNLFQVVYWAGVLQIREMYHEVRLLPHDLNHDSLIVLLDLDHWMCMDHDVTHEPAQAQVPSGATNRNHSIRYSTRLVLQPPANGTNPLKGLP